MILLCQACPYFLWNTKTAAADSAECLLNFAECIYRDNFWLAKGLLLERRHSLRHNALVGLTRGPFGISKADSGENQRL